MSVGKKSFFFFLGTLVMCVNGGGERVWEKEGKRQRGKQLLKRSNTGEGDTLTSCMRCHGYKSPACHPFLAFPPAPPFFTPDILVFERQRQDTKEGEREGDDEKREGYRCLRRKGKNRSERDQ